MKTAVFWRFWGVSTCSCNFLLRNSRLTSSRGRIPIREDDLVKSSYVLTILRCIYMLVQLSSQKQQTYEFSRGNPFPRRWSSEYSYVPMILRCIYMLVQLSSQKQRIFDFSRENPYPRGWSSEKQLCSVDFEVYLRARATFFSETADLVKTAVFWRFWGVSTCSCNFHLRSSGFSTSRGRTPIREDDLVKNSYVLSILRCIYMLVQLSSQKQRIYESSYLRVVLQWTNWYLLTVVRCIFVRVKLFSLETVGVRILAKFSYLRATLQWKMGYLLTVVRCICVCV